MQEVAKGVYRLGTGYINFYFVEVGGRLTIVDSGLPGYWDQIPRALASLGRSFDHVEAVVLTHSHADHIGSAARLKDDHNVRTYIHDADVATAAKAETVSPLSLVPYTWRLWLMRYLAHLNKNGALKAPPLADPATFGDGEVLEVPGRPRIIHAPGHTAGSCALLLEERGILFSGDALVTLDTLRGKTGPAAFTSPFAADEDLAFQSLDRLENIHADLMLPGHGEPWTGGVTEAVRRARLRLG